MARHPSSVAKFALFAIAATSALVSAADEGVGATPDNTIHLDDPDVLSLLAEISAGTAGSLLDANGALNAGGYAAIAAAIDDIGYTELDATPTLLTVTPTTTIAAGPADPTPPTPPTDGPGSDATTYAGARLVVHPGPNGQGGYWLAEPTTDPDGKHIVADLPIPVVLYFSGAGPEDAPTPDEVGAWLRHLARQGRIVIAPIFTPADIYGSSVAALDDALTALESGDHSVPDLEHFGVAAYSRGSAAALEYTVTAGASGHPSPDALFVMAPCVGRYCPAVPEVGETLPRGLRAVVMAFDIDFVVGVEWPQRYYAVLADLPAADRAYVEVHTDTHGSPRILASHDAPIAFDDPQVDSLDRWAIWKTADGLFDCAFANTHCEYALGDGPELTSMGTWSDGTAVASLTMSRDPIGESQIAAAAVDQTFPARAIFDGVLEPAEPLDIAEGVAVLVDGRLVVVDGGNDRLGVFHPTGQFDSFVGRSGDAAGEYRFTSDEGFILGDVAATADGGIMVLDMGNHRVQALDEQFAPRIEFGPADGQPGHIQIGVGITVDPRDGRIFIADIAAGIVHVFDASGKFVEDWGVGGPTSTIRFNQPTDIAIASDGTVYVNENGRSRLDVFSPDGKPVSRWGGIGQDPGRFAENWSVAVDNAGNVLVAEYQIAGYGGRRVQVFSPDGHLIGIIANDATHELSSPVAVAVGVDGAVYVSDEAAAQVARYTFALPAPTATTSLPAPAGATTSPTPAAATTLPAPIDDGSSSAGHPLRNALIAGAAATLLVAVVAAWALRRRRGSAPAAP